MTDKLTPTLLRDLANIASFTTPHNGRDDVRIAPFALLALWLREEAARREAEQKPKLTHEQRLVADPESEPEGLGSAAAFTLEVGKSYARRDGTGPVKIIRKIGGLFYDDLYRGYDSNGVWIPDKETGSDLVSLWQAEAQAPQTDAGDLVQRLRAFPSTVHSPHEAADSIKQLRAALCWALDEIDALSILKTEFAYPQGMAMVGRSDQLDAYVKACEARRPTGAA